MKEGKVLSGQILNAMTIFKNKGFKTPDLLMNGLNGHWLIKHSLEGIYRSALTLSLIMLATFIITAVNTVIKSGFAGLCQRVFLGTFSTWFVLITLHLRSMTANDEGPHTYMIKFLSYIFVRNKEITLYTASIAVSEAGTLKPRAANRCQHSSCLMLIIYL